MDDNLPAAIVDKLDELIAATRVPQWISAKAVGALLGERTDYVLQTLSKRADFPVPVRVGQPRWNKSEILDWIHGPGESALASKRRIKHAKTCLYRHFGDDGRLLYVGISLTVVARTRNHDQSPWFYLVTRITIERFSSRAEAEVAETAAIRNEKPIYNIKHNNNNAAD